MLELKYHLVNVLLKRFIDLLAASSLLVLTLPLFFITAIAIKIDSHGPVFFRQERLGKRQRPFTCYKFRSMYAGTDHTIHEEYIKQLLTKDLTQEKQKGEVFKLTRDPRITRIGRIIRKLSIDELPQLFNVLRGQMSMVGPRPVILYEVAYYDATMFKRFSVKPGITGLWQVSGRSSLGYREMVTLDIFYAEHWSVWLDLKILGKTVARVLKISQAY